jgi:hypothetical protein
MSFGLSAKNANGTEVIGNQYRLLTFGEESFYYGCQYSLWSNMHNNTMAESGNSGMNAYNTGNFSSGTNGHTISGHIANRIFRSTSTENNLQTSLPTTHSELVVPMHWVRLYEEDYPGFSTSHSSYNNNTNEYTNAPWMERGSNINNTRSEPASGSGSASAHYNGGAILTLKNIPVDGEIMYNEDYTFKTGGNTALTSNYPYRRYYMSYYLNNIAGWKMTESSVEYYRLGMRYVALPTSTINTGDYGMIVKNDIGQTIFNAADEVGVLKEMSNITLQAPPTSVYTTGNLNKYGWCQTPEFGDGTSGIISMDLPNSWIFRNSTSSDLCAYVYGFILKRQSNGKFRVITCYQVGKAKGNITGSGYPVPKVPYMIGAIS